MDHITLGHAIVIDHCIKTGKPIPKNPLWYNLFLASTAVMIVGFCLASCQNKDVAARAAQKHSERGR